MKRVLLLLMLSTNIYAHDVGVQAVQTNSSAGYVAHVSSYHAVRLYNGADYPVTNTYRFKLCVDTVKNCAIQTKTVTLPAHSGVPAGKGWSDSQWIILESTMKYPGNYQIVATTEIEGQGSKALTDYSVLSVR